MFTNIRKEIEKTKFPTEITYHKVPSDWGALIADHIDQHEATERFNIRINYNSVAETLLVKIMPTLLHECHVNWMRTVEDEWREQNLLTGRQLRNLKMFTCPLQERFIGPYANSRKIPDYCLKPDHQYQPSFIIEVGWSESYPHLMDDMKLWMDGARPYVKHVLIIEFSLNATTNEVRGKAELYARDPAGNPYRSQQTILFPANVTNTSFEITAGDLFGHVLPTGVAPTTRLPLSIDILRQEARDAMVHMGLTPKP